MRNKEFSTILFPLYILIGLSLTLLSQNFSFLISFGLYYFFVVFIGFLFIKKINKSNFLSIVTLFLSIYSVYAIISHFTFIEDPFTDYFVDIDETKFIYDAVELAKLDYSEIWYNAFSKFQYSGSPLFYAWIGSLQRLSDLNPFYGLLFQKLNVVLFGSFIPGIVYLICDQITDKKMLLRQQSFTDCFLLPFLFYWYDAGYSCCANLYYLFIYYYRKYI